MARCPLDANAAHAERFIVKNDQIALLSDIGQSGAVSDDKRGELEPLIAAGYVAKDGDLYELTPKARQMLSERGLGLNES